MRNRQNEPGCLVHLAITIGAIALVGLIFFIAMRQSSRYRADYAEYLAKFEERLVPYTVLIQDATGQADPPGPYRTGKMVILDEDYTAPGVYTLRGMKNEKLMADGPAQAGSLVLVSVQDFTLARKAYGIHGARYIQSAVIQVIDAATGQLTARGTVWTKAAGWWADPIGQPGVGPPSPFKAKIEPDGKEVWAFLKALPDRGPSGPATAPVGANAAALRFDGLYARYYPSEQEYFDANDYYRFYPDGRVTFIHVQEQITPGEAAAMMAAGHKDSLSANYTLQEGELQFSLVSWTETMRFSGVVRSDALVLLQKWHIERKKIDSTFVCTLSFIEVPNLAP